MEQVGLMPLLEELGVNGALRAAAAGLIVGRLAHPASEPETHRWLGRDSGLGELLGVDYEAMGAMQLYRASDALAKHPRRHRGAAVRARHGPVRPVGHGDAVRSDQHLLRGRRRPTAAGAARAFRGEAPRPSAAHARTGAGRFGLREPLAGVRRQRARANHPAGHAGGSGRAGRRPGGHGPGHRHRGADRLAAGSPATAIWSSAAGAGASSTPKPPRPSPPRRDTRCIWTEGSPRTAGRSA